MSEASGLRLQASGTRLQRRNQGLKTADEVCVPRGQHRCGGVIHKLRLWPDACGSDTVVLSWGALSRFVAVAVVLALAGPACAREDVELLSGLVDPGAECDKNGPECNNCIDDDGNGLIDGFDPHCTGPLDDREDSFSTGIPGDNQDLSNQDCFFDGNSGQGDDGCNILTCCLLDPAAPGCTPGSCTPSQECIDNCAPITPVGCDCFGCCTVCVGSACTDIITHEGLAPDCDIDVIDDPVQCPRCTKIEECGPSCNPAACILCPGQSEADLPPNCGGNVCPPDLMSCTQTGDCDDAHFCSNGCCIAVVN